MWSTVARRTLRLACLESFSHARASDKIPIRFRPGLANSGGLTFEVAVLVQATPISIEHERHQALTGTCLQPQGDSTMTEMVLLNMAAAASWPAQASPTLLLSVLLVRRVSRHASLEASLL
jgi:hypothetical protein